VPLGRPALFLAGFLDFPAGVFDLLTGGLEIAGDLSALARSFEGTIAGSLADVLMSGSTKARESAGPCP
jgi:hypothetical protein